MDQSSTILILAASARAAAFSALRAGLQPWCADLFADLDLQARAPAMAVPAEGYPETLVRAAELMPPGPWMYTGGLENRPDLVRRISETRPLWGNPPEILAAVRNPSELSRCFHDAGLLHPDCRTAPEGLPRDGSWLLKPRAGCGGSGIRTFDETATDLSASSAAAGAPVAIAPRPADASDCVYFQRRIDGIPCAAVYVADGKHVALLGVTRQLVGDPAFGASPFHYCGSIWPFQMSPAIAEAFRRLGRSLATRFGLVGLFGVDAVLDRGVPWPVEVNPRYTASVEILEYASGLPAMVFHRLACERSLDFHQFDNPPVPRAQGSVGKAVLFARRTVVAPDARPWVGKVLPREFSAIDIPELADIPVPGQIIDAPRPLLSLFAQAPTADECYDQLRRKAADLDARFLPPG